MAKTGRPAKSAPGEGQTSMFADDEFRKFTVNRAAQDHRGRISTETDAALDAAKSEDLIRPEHGALVAIVRHAAWAMDNFEATNKPYGAAKLIPGATEALRELKLTPAAQADETGENIDALMRLMGAGGSVERDDSSVSDAPS